MPLEQETNKIKGAKMSDTQFQEHVIEQLNSIAESIESLGDRVSGIEETLSDVTGFASDMLDDDGSLMGGPNLEALRETLSSMVSPMLSADAFKTADVTDNPESLQDLISSLQEFRGRLSGISETISGAASQASALSEESGE